MIMNELNTLLLLAEVSYSASDVKIAPAPGQPGDPGRLLHSNSEPLIQDYKGSAWL
jgi:hypothetical protein